MKRVMPPVVYLILLVTVFTVGQLLVPVLIFENAERLGWAFLPILIGYLVILNVALAILLRYREKRYMRGMMGDEVYFEMFPRDKIREEKKKAKADKKLEKEKQQ